MAIAASALSRSGTVPGNQSEADIGSRGRRASGNAEHEPQLTATGRSVSCMRSPVALGRNIGVPNIRQPCLHKQTASGQVSSDRISRANKQVAQPSSSAM